MPVLECPGVFAMLVPDGWTATAISDLKYELTRAGDSGAAHVSVYKRHRAPITGAEARDLVTRFVTRICPGNAVKVAVLAENDEQHRAVARCRSTSNTGESFDWLVFLVLWRQHFLMCSCTADPGSDLLGESEMMFASIHPLAVRKGAGIAGSSRATP